MTVRNAPYRYIGLALVMLFGTILLAQSNKAFLKEAEQLAQKQDYQAALERYDLAVQVDSSDPKVFRSRARVYKLIGEPMKAAEDLKRSALNDPKDLDLANEAARAFLDIGFLDDAKQMSDQVLAQKPKDLGALQVKTRICLAQGDLDCAAGSAEAALKSKRTTDTHYLHGLVAYERREYDNAVSDFEQVIEWNYVYGDAYVGLANAELKRYEIYTGPTMKMRTLEKVVEQTTLALDLDPSNHDALMARSKAFAKQKEYFRAIDDVSKIIAQGGGEPEVFLQRAKYYQGYGQFQNAINDLNRVIAARPEDPEAFYLRSQNNEMNLDFRSTLRDMEIVSKLTKEQGGDVAELKADMARVRGKVLEMDREDDAPNVRIDEPLVVNGKLQIPAVRTQINVKGNVKDNSPIVAIEVEGKAVEGSLGDDDHDFELLVDLDTSQKEVTVIARDIYDNIAELKLPIERTESGAPAITLLLPRAKGGKIEIEKGTEEILVEGIASDRSLLRSITVNGMNASYDPNRMDPSFGSKLLLKGANALVITATDLHGNESKETFLISRKDPEPVVTQVPDPVPRNEPKTVAKKPKPKPSINSPMGLTWVVFVENNEYKSMPPPSGTSGDVKRMKKAFSQYDVHNTIHKKNMTKAQLERFFNVELRDLVRKNNVNSVLVWYAGHGRVVNKTGYWVPVDGNATDPHMCFNYGGLKARMRSYSGTVTHTMVVSDAAGADPSFYELTR